MLTLFRRGVFNLHSGEVSSWKIDCDALINEDLYAISEIISKSIRFSMVFGIPRGGIRLACALEQYKIPGGYYPPLIVDDVLTTGRSMEEARKQLPNANGCVIFARGKLPGWVKAVFQLGL